jgi:hypothetical protein
VPRFPSSLVGTTQVSFVSKQLYLFVEFKIGCGELIKIPTRHSVVQRWVGRDGRMYPLASQVADYMGVEYLYVRGCCIGHVDSR